MRSATQKNIVRGDLKTNGKIENQFDFFAFAPAHMRMHSGGISGLYNKLWIHGESKYT